ncbi:MAG: ankyrin repeat domain-containing protein [Acidobacteriia bacterium]|nr:ankyrin repeat domain-containing protein [Terriglobia bacterium]
MCRAGRLYEIEKWIADGRPLTLPAKCGSLLQVAVETRFHSLTELIAKHENNQSSTNAALTDAVSSHGLDFGQLLVENGAEVKSVPFSDVLLEWNPHIFRFFLEHGADPVEGSPFAVAFTNKIRTASGPFVELKRSRPEVSAALQEQADCALRCFCGKGDMKWISLMLWAGANPRSLGPKVDEVDENDPECFTTALKEASYSGNVEVLKKLKPDPKRDDLSDLLHCAAVSARSDSIKYLLEIGANPNDKPNGGSSALDTCLWHLNFGSSFPYYRKSLRSKYEVSKGLDSAREVTAHGAIWNPNDQRAFNDLRRALYGCEPEVTIELLQIFKKHNACPTDRLKELLCKPRLKEHLASQTYWLTRLGLKYEEKRSPKEWTPPAHLLAQYNRTGLYEKVWSEPMRILAQQYGVSDVYLARVCRLLRIPLPGLGYWAKKNSGKATKKRPPLPPLPSEREQQTKH